jgi:hypothetical protein
MGRRNGDDGGKTTHLGTSALALVAPLVLFVLLACHSTVYIHHADFYTTARIASVLYIATFGSPLHVGCLVLKSSV